MNKTKRTLILIASIIDLVGIVALLFSLILFASINPNALSEIINEMSEGIIDAYTIKLSMIITSAVGIVFYGIASTMLLVSIRNNGNKFKESKALFITGLVFSIICSPISISSILLYISLGLKNEDEIEENVVKNEIEQDNGLTGEIDDLYEEQSIGQNTDSNSGVKNTIIEYKKLRQKNIITDEEYKIMVVKYLRKIRDEKIITQEQFESLLTKLI